MNDELQISSMLARKTVTESFRNLLVEKYPNLNKSRNYWPLLAYLMFPTRGYNGETLLSSNTFVELLGFSSKPRYFNVENILKEFSKDVQEIKWSGYSSEKGQARLLKSLKWPKEIEEALNEEREKLLWEREERVYILDGKPFSRKKQYKAMKEEKTQAKQFTAKTMATQILLDYMNSLPVNFFSKLIENNSAETFNTIWNLEHDREHQWNIFSGILDDHLQIYKPTDKSVRIFPVGERIVSLKSEVRKSLTKGLIEADLKSAQFAIAAKLWNIPSIEKFLSEGGNIWDYLGQLGNTRKSDIKEVLYSTVFGMHFSGIKEKLREIGIEYKDFIALPLIKDLLEARNAEMRRILKDGGARTCFGDFLKLSEEQDEKSILAQCCQAMELLLLLPIIELANKNRDNHGLSIVLWQHDGFAFSSNDETREDYWKWVLCLTLEEQAKRLGVETRLDLVNL